MLPLSPQAMLEHLGLSLRSELQQKYHYQKQERYRNHQAGAEEKEWVQSLPGASRRYSRGRRPPVSRTEALVKLGEVSPPGKLPPRKTPEASTRRHTLGTSCRGSEKVLFAGLNCAHIAPPKAPIDHKEACTRRHSLRASYRVGGKCEFLLVLRTNTPRPRPCSYPAPKRPYCSKQRSQHPVTILGGILS
jgi:hypothetical protein